MSLAVNEEPGSAVADHGHTVLRIKDEKEWSEGEECMEKEPRCVMQESAGALGSWLLCDRIISLCAPPCGSSCDMLRDHTYASTEYPPADECVKTEPSCWASECADACADYAVKEELELGPECARGECSYPSESSAESVRALAVGARPAQEPRGEELSLRRCSVRLEPAGPRGSDRDTLARTQGDSDIEVEIYTTNDYEKYPTCDMCGRSFAVKTDLMRHVVVHIYTPAGAEQDEGSGGDQDGELPRFLWRWARLVPRECRVRLERCDAPPQTEEEIDVVSLGTSPLPLDTSRARAAPPPLDTSRARAAPPPPPPPRVPSHVPRALASAPRPRAAALRRRRTRAPARRGSRSNTDSEAEAPETERRSINNYKERVRRLGLKNLFDEIKKQIPATRDRSDTPKVVILHEAVSLCRTLRGKMLRNEIERERLRKQQNKLFTKLKELRTRVASRYRPC